MSRIILLDPKLTPHVNFGNFQADETFSFCKFLGRLDEKRAAATPLIEQVGYIWSKHILRIRTNGQKF